MAVARAGAWVAALLACAACSGRALSTPGDLAASPDLASARADGGLPPTCSTASGDDACDPTAQYCYQCVCGDPVHRGAPWPNDSQGCVALPPACAASPTCACVLANAPRAGCSCATVGAQVLLTCFGP
ncbi:MAG TPA: hypothetical protein VF945_08590 [Polyangia bacterium]